MSGSRREEISGVKRVAVFHDLPSGGAKRALRELVQRLVARGVVCDLYRLDTYGDAPPLADDAASATHVTAFATRRLDRLPERGARALANVPIHAVNTALRLVDMARGEELHRELALLIDGRGYDLVFAHAAALTYAPSLLRYLRTPSAYYCQEPPRHLYEPAWRALSASGETLDPAARWARRLMAPAQALHDAVYRRLDARNTRAATTVLVNSLYSREAVCRAYGVDAELAPLGVDTEFYAPRGERDPDLVFSPGRIHPLKGHELALRAVALIPTPRRPRLVVAGDSQLAPFRRRLERLASELGVRLEIRLDVSDALMQSLYASAAVILCLPVMEPLGLVALEAMATGAAVVGVAEGGLRETVIDGVSGIAVPRRVEAVAEAVALLLGDPAMARALGLAARQLVCARWTWERSADALVEVFARTLSRARASSLAEAQAGDGASRGGAVGLDR